MREFIKKMVDSEALDFDYGGYETLFIKHNFNSYYLFFFLTEKNQLLELRNKSGDIFDKLKNNQETYRTNMDKNTTCIFCLCVTEEEYYDIDTVNAISDLSKIICYVEEDLNYFKKNVLLYTNPMKQFAEANEGKFEEICNSFLTEEYFQKYKESNRAVYEYEFLINLFVKIPFLSFHDYQKNADKKYISIEEFIDSKCAEKEIDINEINDLCDKLRDKLDDEEKFYSWLDSLIEEETVGKKLELEGSADEN